MANNDDVLFGIPQIQCPSCGFLLDCGKTRFDKYTKQQRRQRDCVVGESNRGYSPDPFPTGEDSPSDAPEKNFIVVSCENIRCNQYNKFKVLTIPRIRVASAKVDHSD